jgi:hypothetical protein
MAYIGKGLLIDAYTRDFNSVSFIGDGSTTAYTLPEIITTSDESLLIHIDGVKQHITAYSITSDILTFSAPPPNSSAIEVIIFGVDDIIQAAQDSISVRELDTTDGTTGQVLTTDGVGNLSFSSKSTETLVSMGVTSTSAELNILDGVTSTAAELNILDGVTSTAAELNILDGVTSTAAELNYVDGVTSAIQTQINSIVGGAPSIKSANYTAVAGDTVLVTAGAITITLPLSPSAGDTVNVKDGTGTADVTNWTVGRNGSKIASSATDLTFDKNWAHLSMTYINSTIGWSV